MPSSNPMMAASWPSRSSWRTVSDEDVRHLRWLQDRVGDRLLDAAVVTSGPDAYRRQDGIAVVPAALLGPWTRQRPRKSVGWTSVNAGSGRR